MPTAKEYITYKQYYKKANKRAYKYNKQYWEKRHKEYPRRYYDNTIKHHKEHWEFIRKYKESKPCFDCGDWFKSCQMDFDHRDGKVTKVNTVGRLVLGSKKKLYAEIAKCDLVCSNCHRLRTWRRKNVFA